LTVIGHFASVGIISGTAGVISPKVTWRIIAYYLVVMLVFVAWTHVADPRSVAALYIDWTGNLAGLLFVYLYARKGQLSERFFVAMIIGSQLLGGFSHPFDFILLKAIGHIPEGMWRPQHFWHTPLFAVAYSTLVAPLVAKLLRVSFKQAWCALVLGYALHIVADTITYDFPIYWFWPFTDWGAFSLEAAFRPECAGTYKTFGSVLYWFGDNANTPTGLASYNPHWSWIIYWAEPLVNLLLAALFIVTFTLRKAGLTRVATAAKGS
jgi:hypothetical protein